MKKRTLFVFLTAVFVMAACNKINHTDNNGVKPKHYAVIGNTPSKEGGKPIEITYRVGHNASECNSSCLSMNGVPYHADCQGWGEACVITIRLWPIGGQPKGETFNAVVDTVWSLTSEDFFNMPDRSLTVLDTVSEDEMFLNIPAQLVYRDSTTLQFTFTGLSFTNKPLYNNN